MDPQNNNVTLEALPFIVSDQYDGRMKKLYATSCQICPKIFYVPKSRLTKAKFCSIDCSAENQKRIRKAKLAANPVVKKEPKYRVGPRLPGSR